MAICDNKNTIFLSEKNNESLSLFQNNDALYSVISISDRLHTTATEFDNCKALVKPVLIIIQIILLINPIK